MDNFLYIPIVAMFCYLFLVVVFASAKKNKEINSFLLMLILFLLWTSGSFLMRMQVPPGVKFWFDVSIWGVFLLPYGFYNFVHAFIGGNKNSRGKLWLSICIIIGVINMFTGFMIPAPHLVAGINGKINFVYDLSWGVFIIFAYTMIITGDTTISLVKSFKSHVFTKKTVFSNYYGNSLPFHRARTYSCPAVSWLPYRCFVWDF